VHQDGLVHISMMSNKFITDPREVVKAGEVVKVKVLEVDAQRKRIALSMRLDEATPRVSDTGRTSDRDQGSSRSGLRSQPTKPMRVPEQAASVGSGLMAEALAQALKKR